MHLEAGEATQWYVPPAEVPGPIVQRGARIVRDPARVEADNAKRAATRARRFAVGWRMTHMGTLTNEEPVYSWEAIEAKVARFLRRMHADGWDVPIEFFPEPHPGGHGWHVHFVTDRFLPKARVHAWWRDEGKRDFVKMRGPRKGSSPRRAGRYAAKYVGKAIGAEELHGCQPRPAGAHRYWKPRGFELRPVEGWSATIEEGEAALIADLGAWQKRLPFQGGAPWLPAGFWYRWATGRSPPPPRGGSV